MYESQTFDVILKRMLDRVSSSLDKREGSIIDDAVAPAANELQNAYINLDIMIDEAYADTASRYYLIKRAAERGLVPYSATKAVVKGEFNINVPIGTRFSLEDLNYIVREKISEQVFKLECEQEGVKPNSYLGTLIPIEYIEGLTKAEITEILIPGEDEEDTEHFRQRYFDSMDSQAFGGNQRDYKEKTEAIPGVGSVKVYPVWNGGGTVKLVITNSENKKPSPTLVEQVQTAIDPVQNQGQGLGIAPIGHVVTVQGVTETAVNITTKITYQDDWNWSAIEGYVNSTIDAYFSQLNANWADSENIVVRISQIESALLGVTGVLDITGTTLNGAEQNLVINADSIPKRGAVSAS